MGQKPRECGNPFKKWLFSIIRGFFHREKCVYGNYGHLNWVKQLGGDSNIHFHPFSSSIHWLVGGESSKMKIASQFQIAKRKDSAFHYSLAMVNQAEQNYSVGLQKLYNFFHQCFLRTVFSLESMFYVSSFWDCCCFDSHKCYLNARYLFSQKMFPEWKFETQPTNGTKYLL